MKTLTIATIAAACALNVANIYFAHPLLDAMAAEFAVAPAAIGGVVALTQIGYALGLVFIVPLGDLIDRRRLVQGQAILSAAALAGVATARGPAVFLACMTAVGLLAVAAQVLVAFAAALAPAAERGRVVGTVTGAIVIGILGARVAAGTLSDLGGWRLVYLVSAGCTLILAAMLSRLLPRRQGARPAIGYGALLRSVPRLFRDHPLLRVRAALAFLIFASFATFWTSLVLPLSAPPLSLSHTRIGLFGLAGLAGALAAGRAGRLADRGRGQATTGAALALLLLSWGPIALLPQSLAALVVGLVLLDLAVQTVHVTSQSLILALAPEAQSRIVGGYMVFYSAGSASGAAASTAAFGLAGWAGVCVLGAGFALAGLAVWAATRRIGLPPARLPDAQAAAKAASSALKRPASS